MSNSNPLLSAPALPSLTQAPGTLVAPKSLPLVGTLTPPTGSIIRPELITHKDRRADLLWGRSKSGKGINAWMGALWMLVVYGKKFLYITAEPSSCPKVIQDLIAAGLGDMFIVSAINPLGKSMPLLAILSTVFEGGKWPVYLKKNDGSIVRSFNSVEAQCDPKQYGLIIADSLTSLGEELIKWYTLPENSAIIPMSPGVDKFSIKDSVEGGNAIDLRGSSPTHVGEAVRYLQRMVTGSANLPYQKVLWIARECRGSRGEKKDKAGNILVAGEPMYGPDLPGTAATPRVTGWFGGAYHCDAVPREGTKDDRPTAAANNPLMAASAAKLSMIPEWEYRIYLKPHPDPITGLFYDAGNRLPPYFKLEKPYVVCESEEANVPGGFTNTGLNTIWELERTQGTEMVGNLKEKFADVLSRFGGGATKVGDAADFVKKV